MDRNKTKQSKGNYRFSEDLNRSNRDQQDLNVTFLTLRGREKLLVSM